MVCQEFLWYYGLKRGDRMDKFFRKLVFKIILVSVVAIVFINVILLIPNNHVEHSNDWIGFYGSFISTIIAGVFGGYITYKGVRETIDDNRTLEAERQKLSIRPALQIRMRDTQGYFEDNEENKKYSLNFHDALDGPIKDAVMISICLEVVNLGTGFATHMLFKLFIDGDEENKQSDAVFYSIGKGEKIKYYINGINILKFEEVKKIKVIIQCKDMLLNEYVQEINMSIKEYQVFMNSCGILEERKKES